MAVRGQPLTQTFTSADAAARRAHSIKNCDYWRYPLEQEAEMRAAGRYGSRSSASNPGAAG